MTKKKWVLKNQDRDKISKLISLYGLSPIVAQVLQSREALLQNGIDDLKNPSLENLHDPFLLRNMDAAVSRIETAMEHGQKITIYGDYDVDGVTSSTVLYKYLSDKGVVPEIYIPDRLKEGYGINNEALKKIKDGGTSLVISVDTGIVAVENTEYASSIGLDVIITDHHEPKDAVPRCEAVINPKQSGCSYPFKDLSGVGVAFKLIHALEISLAAKRKGRPFNLADIEKYIPFVCLGTIADVAPLVGENRILVKFGLEMLPKCENAGVKAIISAAKLENKKINVGNVGFTIAPRLNVAGRLGSAYKAVEVFLCDDYERAVENSNFLTAENVRRQNIEAEIYAQAVEKIEKDELHKKNIIIVEGKDWHHGVIGIVSSKITDRYCKPSILLVEEGDFSRGSGRSVKHINLFEAVNKFSSMLSKFGGHSMAVGLTIEHQRISEFYEALDEYIGDIASDEDSVPVISVDAEIPVRDVTLENAKSIRILEPFGIGNTAPVFLVSGVRIKFISAFSEGKHLRLQVVKQGMSINVIGFSMGHMVKNLRMGEYVDILGVLDVNEYNGEEYVQLLLKDLRKVK